jgi:hypothetical protein
MSVGLPISKGEIDQQAGSIARSLHNVLHNAVLLKGWLDTQTTPDLTALGYTEGEVAVLKSAYADLAELAAVFAGGEPRETAYDYRTFAKLLIGTGLY